jgi:hypothetical protein
VSLARSVASRLRTSACEDEQVQQAGARNISVVDFFWFSMAIAGVVVYMVVLIVRGFLRRRGDGR